ncbi:MAG: hypothetical protein U9Q71_08925 [Pseudomonadota bacterium]|nr:hypothetical protein [Pseudomonadota bacterium]
MIRKMKYHRIVAFPFIALAAVAASNSQAGYPVAGADPSARPVGAPAITAVAKDEQWYRQALTGISQPYPASLGFLEDQGNWDTPFNNPGMTGPYDLRGWHQTDSK